LLQPLPGPNKSRKKPKILTDQAYGKKKTLKRMQIFQIITEINEGKTQLIIGIPTSKKNNKHTDGHCRRCR
jgi:hypothetical protein